MTTIAYMRGYETRRIPFGFSWTTLLFGFWPSVFRAHWGFALIVFSSTVFGWFFSVLVFKGEDAGISMISVQVFMASIRNSVLHSHLESHGWRIGQRAPVIPINVASNN